MERVDMEGWVVAAWTEDGTGAGLNPVVLLEVPSTVDPFGEDVDGLEGVIEACAPVPAEAARVGEKAVRRAEQLTPEERPLLDACVRGPLRQVSIDGRVLWSADGVVEERVRDLAAIAEAAMPVTRHDTKFSQ